MMLIVMISNFYFKVLSMITFVLYTCFAYNIVVYREPTELKLFIINIFICIWAMVENVDSYLEEEEIQERKDR